MSENLLLIYDGDCRFCRFGIQFVHTLDLRRALDFCPFGLPAAEERLSVLPEAERYASFHAATDDGLFSGTDAARKTIEALPFGRIATAFGVHNLYPVLAGSRSILGRFVPDMAAIVTSGRRPDPSGNGKVVSISAAGHG
jgi:predicted DCC family thiol-disulfide oxidoreductase YuxK